MFQCENKLTFLPWKDRSENMQQSTGLKLEDYQDYVALVLLTNQLHFLDHYFAKKILLLLLRMQKDLDIQANKKK